MLRDWLSSAGNCKIYILDGGLERLEEGGLPVTS